VTCKGTIVNVISSSTDSVIH